MKMYWKLGNLTYPIRTGFIPNYVDGFCVFDLNRFRFFTFIFFIFEYLYTYIVVLYYILTNSWIFVLYIIWIVGSRKSSVNPMQAMLGMNLLSLLRLVAALSHKCFQNIAITNALCNYCMRTTCTQYSDILVKAQLLTENLLNQEYIVPRLKSSTHDCHHELVDDSEISMSLFTVLFFPLSQTRLLLIHNSCL
jgi:hypothetical protein